LRGVAFSLQFEFGAGGVARLPRHGRQAIAIFVESHRKFCIFRDVLCAFW
jgi:hypothetical protein